MPDRLSGLSFSFTQAEARAFSLALGRGEAAAIPSGIAMKILFKPDVVSWIKNLVGDMTPIHMEQGYDYHIPLEPNIAYKVDVMCNAVGADKWDVTTHVFSPHDKLALKMTSLFLAHTTGSEP